MSYSTDLLAIKNSTHIDVTIKTAPSSISPSNVGTNIENLITLLQTGGLPQILSLGNTANASAGETANFGLVDASNTYSLIANGTEIYIAESGNVIGRLGLTGGSIFLDLVNATSPTFKSSFSSGVLTANQTLKTLDASGSISTVIASHDVTAQSGTISPFLDVPVANTCNFLISGYINVTTYSSSSLFLNVSFKDVHGTVVSGYHIGIANSAGYFAFPAIQIRALAGYNLYIILADGSVGNTYDAGCTVTQIS